jgi:hypothetical protein
MKTWEKMKFLQSNLRSVCELIMALLLTSSMQAQETFPVNGVVNKNVVRTALEHATVHLNATEIMEDATVVIYQGRIEQVGRQIGKIR